MNEQTNNRIREELEKIIIEWLKKEKNDGQYVGDYDGEYDLDNCCLDGYFDLKDLADELLKSQKDSLAEKIGGLYKEAKNVTEFIKPSKYNEALDDILSLIKEE